MFYIAVWIISRFFAGTDMIFIYLLFDLQTSQEEKDDSKLSQKAKKKEKTRPGHSTQTPCKNTLDPCSSTHIASHCPSCCDSDGKDPYYFDRL